jgi:integrase/recombinase XerD
MKTVEQAIKEFIFHCKYEKKLSKKTTKAYETDCQQFNAFLMKEANPLITIESIDKNILKSFIFNLKDMKPKTLKRKLATLKSMFNFLEFEDEIAINPFRKMKINIKEPFSLPQVMSITEVEKILSIATANVQKCQAMTFTYFEKLRNLVVLELLFATGSRVSEISNLKITDIDLIDGSVKIFGKGSKQRVIQICHPDVLEILRKYHKLLTKKMIKKEYFFVNRLGGKLSDQSIRLMIKNYCNQSKIKKKITPHTFRHSFATLMLEQNVDIKYIQGILGHSSIMTTQIYTHVNNHKQREILSLQHPRKLINSSLNKG